MNRLIATLIFTSCSPAVTPLPAVDVACYHCSCDIICETGTTTTGGVVQAVGGIYAAEIEFEYNRCTVSRACGRDEPLCSCRCADLGE
jgi:hypothetical protein